MAFFIAQRCAASLNPSDGHNAWGHPADESGAGDGNIVKSKDGSVASEGNIMTPYHHTVNRTKARRVRLPSEAGLLNVAARGHTCDCEVHTGAQRSLYKNREHV